MNFRKPYTGGLAKARPRHQPGVMNKAEERYHDVLCQRADVLAVWFEQWTLKIGADCRYTPDFMVMMQDGTLEAHEVKGHWEDDALVKIKTAASMFPMVFRAVTYSAKEGWTVKEIAAILPPVVKG